MTRAQVSQEHNGQELRQAVEELKEKIKLLLSLYLIKPKLLDLRVIIALIFDN